MELSQMLGCRENDNPCQLTRHTTPLSPWRGAGGEALLPSLFVEGLGVRLYSPSSERRWA